MDELKNALILDEETEAEVEEAERPSWRNGNFFLVFRRFIRNRVALFGLLIIAVIVIMALFAPLLAGQSYTRVSPFDANQPSSLAHWFGTDNLGRDIYARILYGARYSLAIGFAAELMGFVIAVILGTIGGYFGGRVDNVIQRCAEVIHAIPNILLCICVAQALGSGLGPTMLALSIGGVPAKIRLLRSTIMSIREQEFIEAAKATNCSQVSIMFRSILPNCMAPLLVVFSTDLGNKIMTSASLSYLGLGIQEPIPEWGAMIAAGKSYLLQAPHIVIIPGIFIALTVLSFNLIGDGLRDALDPKLRS